MLISTVEDLIGILRGFPRDARIKICDYRKEDNPVPENIESIHYLENLNLLFLEGGKGFNVRSDKEEE